METGRKEFIWIPIIYSVPEIRFPMNFIPYIYSVVEISINHIPYIYV